MQASVHKTVLKMLQKRGYEVTEVSEDKILAMNEGEKVVVMYNDFPKLDVEKVKDFIASMIELKCSHLIVVYKGTVTPVARNVIEKFPIASPGDEIEIFDEKSLRYDITEHSYVPKHEKLSESEAEKFRKTFGTTIPKLLTVDPVARLYHFKKGDIIRIFRKEGEISYRIVR